MASITSGVWTKGSPLFSLTVGFQAYSGRGMDAGTSRIGVGLPGRSGARVEAMEKVLTTDERYEEQGGRAENPTGSWPRTQREAARIRPRLRPVAGPIGAEVCFQLGWSARLCSEPQSLLARVRAAASGRAWHGRPSAAGRAYFFAALRRARPHLVVGQVDYPIYLPIHWGRAGSRLPPRS